MIYWGGGIFKMASFLEEDWHFRADLAYQLLSIVDLFLLKMFIFLFLEGRGEGPEGG